MSCRLSSEIRAYIYVGTTDLGPRVKALDRKKTTTWPAEKVTYLLLTYSSSTTHTSGIMERGHKTNKQPL